jgi:hypothetical protein
LYLSEGAIIPQKNQRKNKRGETVEVTGVSVDSYSFEGKMYGRTIKRLGGTIVCNQVKRG